MTYSKEMQEKIDALNLLPERPIVTKLGDKWGFPKPEVNSQDRFYYMECTRAVLKEFPEISIELKVLKAQ